MQIEQEQPSTKSVQSILENPNNRTKVIKMMIQSLRLMGWHASAKQLSLQSSINSDEESIEQIKQHLKNFEYLEAAQQIKKVDLPLVVKNEIEQTIHDLHVMYLIKNNLYEQAIEKATNLSSQKQVKFFTMIGLGFQEVNNIQFQTKQASIIQKCLKDTVQMSCLHKMLTNYISDDRFLTKKMKIRPPPKTIVAQSQVLSNIVGKVTFTKFNKSANLIAVISESYRQTQISVWNIADTNIKKKNSCRIQSIGCINSVKWSQILSTDHQQLLGICSYSSVIIFNTPELQKLYSIKASNLILSKMLCFEWHPISELLYVGGLFDCSYGFDVNGELVTSITPFIKSRQIVFSQQGDLFAISATKGQLIKFCMETEKQINKFVTNYCLMDLKYYPSINTVIVSNKEHIYLLDCNTFHINNTFDSPSNPKMFKIQVFLFQNWTIIFNQKLSAIVQNDKVTRHSNWSDCDTVDVKNNKMVTFKSVIRVWQSSQNQHTKEINQQIDVDQDQDFDFNNHNFQSDSESESAVEESVEQINQQIINLEQNQDQYSEFDEDDI